MKKHILLALCIGLSVVSASAQHYRGFLDFTTTVPVVNTNGYGFEYADIGGATIGGSTSHGIQLKNIFIGAGAGALYVPSSYSVGIPVFAEARWDFFRGRMLNFFVGCKLGWVLNAGDEDGVPINDECEYSEMCGMYGGIYIHPSVGLRFRLNSTMGINLALSYIPLRFDVEKYCYYYSYDPYINERWNEYSKFWSHRIALSVGLDF